LGDSTGSIKVTREWLVAPRYYVALGQRAYLLKPDGVVFIGRPDIAVVSQRPQPAPTSMPLAEAGILDVDVPMNDRPTENFLQV